MRSAGESSDLQRTAATQAAEQWSGERYTWLIQQGADQYGEAFLAYLVLDGVEQRSMRLVEEFEAAFVNWYPDRATFIDEQLEDRGWNALMSEVFSSTDIEPTDLDWNDGALWDHLTRIYRTTERLGGVYVFRR